MKNVKGITLIALVITIIVLLILAGVSISLTLGENGILTKAQGAASSHGEAEVKEQIGLAYNAWKVGNLTGDTEELKNYLKDELSKVYNEENVSVNEEDGKLVVIIISNGTTHSYKLGLEGDLENYVPWIDNGEGTFTKGDTTLKIGDYIAYDHTKDVDGNDVTETTGLDKTLAEYTDGWRVLGLKDGKIQLLSAQSVGQKRWSSPYYIPTMNSYSAAYEHGKGAQSGRSINVEDINDITGYDPSNTGDGKPFDYGTVGEYGNEVDYFWSGYTTNNGYSYAKEYYTDGTHEGTTQYGMWETSSVRWFDSTIATGQKKGSSATSNSMSSSDTPEGRVKFITLTSDYYYYYPKTLTTNSTGEQNGLDPNSDIYKLLFGNNDMTYWLATNYTQITGGTWYNGLYAVTSGARIGYSGAYEYGRSGVMSSYQTYGLRPLITLSNDIEIVKNETDHDGTTKEKACLIQ